VKTVGIAIDAYKLPTFKRILEAAGYAFTEAPGLSQGTLLLKVKTDSVADLQPIVEKANRECRT
jgi:hypothetical protein